MSAALFSLTSLRVETDAHTRALYSTIIKVAEIPRLHV